MAKLEDVTGLAKVPRTYCICSALFFYFFGFRFLAKREKKSFFLVLGWVWFGSDGKRNKRKRAENDTVVKSKKPKKQQISQLIDQPEEEDLYLLASLGIMPLKVDEPYLL